MKNSCTVPRDPDMAEEMRKVERSPDVFQFHREFRSHHDDEVLTKIFREERTRVPKEKEVVTPWPPSRR